MDKITLQQLLMSGAHFGHMAHRWNPKMKPYIFMRRNKIFIIDLNKTLECIESAMSALVKIVRNGEEVLLVGTKKQAKDIVRVEAER